MKWDFANLKPKKSVRVRVIEQFELFMIKKITK